MTALPADVALLVIDLQPDFMPGGALACDQGDALVAPIADLLAQRRYRTVVATQDWHPADHASFASQHPGQRPFETILLHAQPQTLWPDHCVQGSAGAALHPGVDWTVADLILRKGTRQQVDSYSAFRENHGPDGERPATGLAGWLHERRIREVHVCGLARDYCVLWSAQDAVKSGFRVKLSGLGGARAVALRDRREPAGVDHRGNARRAHLPHVARRRHARVPVGAGRRGRMARFLLVPANAPRVRGRTVMTAAIDAMSGIYFHARELPGVAKLQVFTRTRSRLPYESRSPLGSNTRPAT